MPTATAGIVPVDTAWVLVATLLGTLAIVGAAVYQAGMVRSKNAVATGMYVVGALGMTSVAWVTFGFSFAFGPDYRDRGLVGGIEYAALGGLDDMTALPGNIPAIAFALFHLVFASLAAALVTGAGAERMRYSALLIVIPAWLLAVYSVVAHWVHSPDGWMQQWGVVDYAGGTTLGVAVGASGLAVALVVGPRNKWRKRNRVPHNRPLAYGGALLMWAGWLALVGGATLTPDREAATAILGAHLAAVGAVAGWFMIEKRLSGKPTGRGAVQGLIAGLAAALPAAGFVSPFSALLLGFIAGVLSAAMSRAKYALKVDDPLNTVALFLVPAVVGMIFVGLFGRDPAGAGDAVLGALNGGSWRLLGVQAVGALTVAAYSFVATALVAWIARAGMGLRVTPTDEGTGLDESQHDEHAYDIRD